MERVQYPKIEDNFHADDFFAAGRFQVRIAMFLFWLIAGGFFLFFIKKQKKGIAWMILILSVVLQIVVLLFIPKDYL